MIIQGLIETDKGPIDVTELAVGDKVLDQNHRPRAVTEIKTAKVKGAFTFAKNPGLVLSKKTKIRTVYGTLSLTGTKNLPITMACSGTRNVPDVAIPQNGEFTAYDIRLEGGNTFYASHYCVGTEETNA